MNNENEKPYVFEDDTYTKFFERYSTSDPKLPPYLKIIDILILFPEFEKAVENVRIKLRISPAKVNSMVKEYLGDSKYDLYVKRKKQINDLFYTGDNIAGEDIFNKILEANGKTAKSLVKWQSHNFPKLDIYISSIRLLTFGKLPKVYHDAIKEYVLYGTKNPTPVLFRRQQPVITIEKDKKTIDPYINIKIYVDTDISTKSIFSTKLLDYIRGLQTELPNYFKPLTVPQASSFIRTWLYLYLTESKGLSSIKANDILENQYHLTPVEQAHLTQTVKTRFKDIFKQ